MEANANISVHMDTSQTKHPACLSDVEDISDIDVEDAVDKLHNTISSKPSYDEKKSLFNTTLDPVDEDLEFVNAKAAIEAFILRVEQEQQMWESFANKYMKIPKKKKDGETINKPSEEQQAYLDKAPNLQNYIRGFGRFMSDTHAFIQQFEETQVLQRNLSSLCQGVANQTLRNNIAESLANKYHR